MPDEPPTARHSTLRSELHRAVFLADLAKLWDIRPELSFGELMGGSFDPFILARFVQLADAQVLEGVRRFVGGPEAVSTTPLPPER